jgi:hypothetical protein
MVIIQVMRATKGTGWLAILGYLVEKQRPELDANDRKEISVPALRVTMWRNQYPTL